MYKLHFFLVLDGLWTSTMKQNKSQRLSSSLSTLIVTSVIIHAVDGVRGLIAEAAAGNIA